MAGIVGIYASIGEHVPWITKREKYHEPVSESWVNRCHYRATSLLILVFVIAVTSTEWIAGTESIIDCLHHGAIPGRQFDGRKVTLSDFWGPFWATLKQFTQALFSI